MLGKWVMGFLLGIGLLTLQPWVYADNIRVALETCLQVKGTTTQGMTRCYQLAIKKQQFVIEKQQAQLQHIIKEYQLNSLANINQRRKVILAQACLPPRPYSQGSISMINYAICKMGVYKEYSDWLASQIDYYNEVKKHGS